MWFASGCVLDGRCILSTHAVTLSFPGSLEIFCSHGCCGREDGFCLGLPLLDNLPAMANERYLPGFGFGVFLPLDGLPAKANGLHLPAVPFGFEIRVLPLS